MMALASTTTTLQPSALVKSAWPVAAGAGACLTTLAHIVAGRRGCIFWAGPWGARALRGGARASPGCVATP
jgi:hypothetical protein